VLQPLHPYFYKVFTVTLAVTLLLQGVTSERKVIFMFGKKKEKNFEVKAMHYEGIEQFASDYPCRLEVKDDTFIITRIKPETTVTLPMNRIQSFTAMEEARFMEMYHGEAKETSKAKNIKKYYLVVKYDKGMLAFWGSAMEWGKFIELQKMTLVDAPKTIEL